MNRSYVYGSAAEALAAYNRGGRVGQWPPSCATYEQEQKKVSALFQTLDGGVSGCRGKLDAQTLGAWEAMRLRVMAFVNASCFFLTITDDDLEVGRQLERELGDWWKKLADKGCMGDAPKPAQPGKPSGGLGDLLGDFKTIALIFLAYEILKTQR